MHPAARPDRRITTMALGLAVLTTALTACSAEGTSSESPSSSRMVRPSEVPDVSVSDATSDPDGLGAATTQVVNMPEQVWVRSASYANKTYHVTVATAPGGTYNVYDARAVGGMALKGYEGGDCTVAQEKPLPSPVKGAIKQVTRLVTLTCPAATAFTMPVVQGQWGDGPKGGSAQAIFALGGADQQGRPVDPTGEQTHEEDSDKFDTTVVSVRHTGTTITARAWATQFVGLDLEENSPSAGGDTSLPDCATKLLPGQKAGVRNPAPQRLFEVTCSKLDPKKTYSLFANAMSGQVGEEPTFQGFAVDLKPGAQVMQ